MKILKRLLSVIMVIMLILSSCPTIFALENNLTEQSNNEVIISTDYAGFDEEIHNVVKLIKAIGTVEYTFYQRVAETSTHNASESSEALVVKTNPAYTIGDLDGNDDVTDSDAMFLLMYTFFPEDYEVNQAVDFDGDGEVTDADAVYLLMYTFFPEDYPIA